MSVVPRRTALPLALMFASLSLSSMPLLASEPANRAADGRAGPTGRVTGLALPRFVSLKARTVNMRVGPGTQYPIAWTYQRAGWPVQVVEEHGLWRKVRDADGDTGWVLHSLLTGRRTALVTPWNVVLPARARSPLVEARRGPARTAAVAAKLQAGRLVRVRACDSAWCAIEAEGREAWLPQSSLWGVGSKEVVK